MSQVQDGLSLTRQFDDYDALAANLPGWQIELCPVDSSSGFVAQAETVVTTRLQMDRFRISSSLLVTGSLPGQSHYGLGILLAASGPVRHVGQVLDPVTMAALSRSGQEIHMVWNGPVDILSIAVDGDLMERHVQAHAGLDLASFRRTRMCTLPPGSPSWGERGRALVKLQAVLASGAGLSAEARRRLEDCILQIALEDIAAGEQPATGSGAGRWRTARQAEELLRSRLDDPPSLAELCAQLGTPERTLHHAFHEAFGLRPKAYLRALRLNAARRRLRRAEGTVTEVALDLGFLHFGRFAGEYHAMFGESPSDTLRHARADGPVARDAPPPARSGEFD